MRQKTFIKQTSLAILLYFICLAPVSYTHLDVYKRQVIMGAKFPREKII